jgi:hypothetical protein
VQLTVAAIPALAAVTPPRSERNLSMAPMTNLKSTQSRSLSKVLETAPSHLVLAFK